MRFFLHLMVFGMTAAIFGGLAVMLFIQYYSRDLPNFDQLENYNPPHLTRLYSADGKILEEYATETRLFVPITSIPLRLRQAFLAAEDRNFYEHSGIDFQGLARAAATNIMNMGRGRALVGGSTIAQQVVKNFLLSNEQTVDRKIKEAILAFRISSVFSKDKILELYLNEIYLGLSSYGVAAAALNYFNKSIDELTIEESALLAMLPKAPSQFNPRRNYTRAMERRNYVIDRMELEGFITEEEGDRAKQMPIILRERDDNEVTRAPSFAEEVRRQIIKAYGNDALYQGGLTVHTTLEPPYQAMAEKALARGIQIYDRRHGWRGPIKTVVPGKNWLKQLAEVPKPTGIAHHGWHLAMVLSTSAHDIKLGIDNGGRGYILQQGLEWVKTGKALERGDIILVERFDENGEQAKKEKEEAEKKKALAATTTIQEAPKVEEEKKKEEKEEEKDDGKTAYRYELRQIPTVDGALVAMDPHTGRVLAMVGGLGFRNAEYNRATQARRQPGSSFKPFIYLAALEKGMNATTTINDSPISLSQGAGLPAWSPQNYSNDFLGSIPLRVALEKSRNVPAVRVALMVGLDKVIEISQRFGVYEKLPKNFSVVLGSAETTLIRLVTGYAMIVNGGKRVQATLIDRIADRHGKLIYKRDRRGCPNCIQTEADAVSDTVPVLTDTREQVTDPISAYQLVSILEGVVQRGTATRAKVLGRPLAGKTGTTNNSIDSWFVGFSPDLVAGVFVGFDQPHTLGAKETGGSVALPAWVDFMTQALMDKPITPFRIPPGAKLVRMDAATGRPAGAGTPDNRIVYEAFKPDPTPSEAGEGASGGAGGYYPAADQGYDQPAIVPPGTYIAPPPSPDVYIPPPVDSGTPSMPTPSVAPNVAPAPPPTYQPRRSPTLGTGGLY